MSGGGKIADRQTGGQADREAAAGSIALRVCINLATAAAPLLLFFLFLSSLQLGGRINFATGMLCGDGKP